jgi:ABC-type arginine/histidine transport system permease subunit
MLMKMWKQSMKRIFKIFLLVALFYIIFYVAYILALPFLFNWLGTNIETQKPIIIFLSKLGNSFLLPLMVAILLFYFGIIEKERIQYLAGLNELISEMNYNCSKILEFPTNVEHKYTKYIKEGKLDWLPKKESYTNWADGNNFYYKYLPTNAYFNFINDGYILDKKYLIIPTGNIAKFWDQFLLGHSIHYQIIRNKS